MSKRIFSGAQPSAVPTTGTIHGFENCGLQDEYDCTLLYRKPTRDTFHKIQKLKNKHVHLPALTFGDWS